MKVRILLADDHQLVRQGVRCLLETAGDMTVVGEAADGRAAVALVGELAPDVVLMDIEMPHLDGIEATRQIEATHQIRVLRQIQVDRPPARVLMVTMHSERRYVFDAFKAGARGYLLKDATFADLANAVRTVAAGHTYLSPKLADDVVGSYLTDRPPGDVPRPAPALTTREREVLQLVANGRATKQIAVDLNVSIKTIETHRRQIMDKLQLYSVAELTKYAILQGLTSLV
jgi:DNA-binding NarL/FixJ family response regulator